MPHCKSVYYSCVPDNMQETLILTWPSDLWLVGDPTRPNAPPTPNHVFDMEDPEEMSLIMTAYKGNYISAWNLESCLTDGFRLATTVIVADEPTHRTPLAQHTWVCDSNGVEMVVVSQDPRSYELTYFDLSMVLALISDFHQRYAMRDIAFNILGPRVENYVQVGRGWVDLSPDRVRPEQGPGNGTAIA